MLLLTSAFGLSMVAEPAWSQDIIQRPRNNFSRVGLIDMPSARMAPDGELAAGVGFTENIQHYNLVFQVMPWLEAGFHYNGLQDLSKIAPVYFDRSFSAKFRLLNESEWVPALAVGFNDFVGTGLYGGEYVVASKQIGMLDFTLGMGWGRMGSTAQFTNPLTVISESFRTRPGTGSLEYFNDFGTPGSVPFDSFFRGPSASLFGGVAWTTPIEGLTLMAEYSSDAYTLEATAGTFRPRNQFNFGASYSWGDSVTLGLNWLYGESIGASITFQANPIKNPFPQRMGPPLPVPKVRTDEERQQGLAALRGIPFATPRFAAAASLADAMWTGGDVRNVDVRGTSISITLGSGDAAAVCRQKATLAGGSGMAISEIQVLQNGVMSRCAVAGYLPLRETAPAASATRNLNFVTIDASLPKRPTNAEVTLRIRRAATAQNLSIDAVEHKTGQISVYYSNRRFLDEHDAIDRLTRILMNEAPPDVEKFRLVSMVNGVPHRQFEIMRAPLERDMNLDGAPDILAAAVSGPVPMYNPALAARTMYPRFSWSLFPQFRQQLFDPLNPLGVQFLLGAAAEVELAPGLSVLGLVESNLFDDFNVTRTSDSVLPHVRSDFVNYFSKGKNGLAQLDVSYRFRLTPNVYAFARAGFLESMFAGVGGEVLWRPEGQRWAVGADAYQVWQRGFTRLFSTQNYNTLTGHINFYYASPWHDLNLMVSAGRYLAGDTGVTVQVTRRFASGVEIGAFLTRTNVSAADFGEGSFDKGIIIRIPLDFVVPVNTTASFSMDLRPLQRDGGQRLLGDAILYDETRPSSQAEMYLRSNGRHW